MLPDSVHILLYDPWKPSVKFIYCFPLLKENIRILGRSPEYRMIRIQRPAPKRAHRLIIHQFLDYFFLYDLYFLNFMRSPKTVKKMYKGNS